MGSAASTRGDRPVFSASRISAYLTCPRAYYFRYSMGVQLEQASWSALVGQSYHYAVANWHSLGRRDTPEALVRDFVRDLRERILKTERKGLVIDKYEGEPSVVAAESEAVEILGGYVADRRNAVDLALNEVRFEVDVRSSGKTEYRFTGWIDQLRKLPDGRLYLVDLKTGKNRPNNFLLRLDFQLSLYAIACVKGRFFERGQDGKAFEFGVRPDMIAIAHLRDYRLRKKNEFTPFIQDPEKRTEINPETKRKRIIEVPNPQHAQGYKIGDPYGPVFYRTERSEFDLRQAEVDVARVCAAIRRKEFFRRPAAQGSCIGFCRFTKECTEERAEPI